MNGTRGSTLWILAMTVALPSLSCRARADAESDPRPGRKLEGVVAVVNQRPITQLEVEVEARGASGHGSRPASASVLETVIRQELAAARAVELGLDADPAYQEELRAREADLAAFKRKRLSELFYRKGVADKASVAADEARAWFDAHQPQVRTELHLWQIFLRDRAEIDEARRALDAGAPFEEVAGRRFKGMPVKLERDPWDLGFLRWSQVPEEWRDVVYALQPGQTSGVIEGPKSRFWIVKVVARRDRADVTFDSERQTILDQTQASRAARLREDAARELRNAAKIVYVER